jgi:hypothetical protein
MLTSLLAIDSLSFVFSFANGTTLTFQLTWLHHRSMFFDVTVDFSLGFRLDTFGMFRLSNSVVMSILLSIPELWKFITLNTSDNMAM